MTAPASTPRRPQTAITVSAPSPNDSLFGFEALAARIGAIGLLLMALSNGAVFLLLSENLGLRTLRALVTVGSLVGFLWFQRRVPPLRVRLILGLLLTLWIVISTTLDSRFGWPVRLELVPVACAFLAVTVRWPLALALCVGTALGVGGAFVTGVSPVPAYLVNLAGNWIVVSGVLLFVLHRLLRTFAAGVTDLLSAARSLEEARTQAAVVTDELTVRVQRGVDTLAASLPQGPEAARRAARALRETLQQSRHRIPAEVPLTFGTLRGRLIAVRQQLARTCGQLGLLYLPVQAIRLGVGGTPPLLTIALTEIVLLLAILGFTRQQQRRWRLASWLTAVIAVAGHTVTYAYWDTMPDVPLVPPSVALHLLVVVLLGVITGELPVMVTAGVAMAVGSVAVAGRAGVMSAVVCLIYTMVGVMMTRLPSQLLEGIAGHRREAEAAIRRRRRVVGTLVHDLANPLLVITATLDEAWDSGRSTVPHEVRDLLTRMQATIDGVLGRLQPPEVVTARVLVDAVAAVFQGRLESKSLRLIRRGDLDTPMRCPRSLVQDTVLANLVSNAIKFSPMGGTLTIEVRRTGDLVHVEVRDEGPGLPVEVRAAVAAGRVAPSRTGSAGEIGTGYGLLLARDYLQEMGGSLTFEHPPSGGLVARMTLGAS